MGYRHKAPPELVSFEDKWMPQTVFVNTDVGIRELDWLSVRAQRPEGQVVFEVYCEQDSGEKEVIALLPDPTSPFARDFSLPVGGPGLSALFSLSRLPKREKDRSMKGLMTRLFQVAMAALPNDVYGLNDQLRPRGATYKKGGEFGMLFPTEFLFSPLHLFYMNEWDEYFHDLPRVPDSSPDPDRINPGPSTVSTILRFPSSQTPAGSAESRWASFASTVYIEPRPLMAEVEKLDDLISVSGRVGGALPDKANRPIKCGVDEARCDKFLKPVQYFNKQQWVDRVRRFLLEGHGKHYKEKAVTIEEDQLRREPWLTRLALYDLSDGPFPTVFLLIIRYCIWCILQGVPIGPWSDHP
uniref:Uncharacterized protein n=1 Tax=Chromera velia CCMP2878 TaxID=1169474 RepID=A0A0G4HF78_9ALVE|eukprot:Cvel_26878.t1-p1 / transcript=Cvel_26878.t1 / gene=Cvel_26878 / organism=Chromera_velia_CCMP2878 / gene_product=hypothetical protein / transcript_product=hypothetical protein / location=Cvel_scaffold3265:17012-18073(-) / protein_length=354 / sequence_SO=supercontig / SO=protein_coding / is_pseudo=false